MSTVTEQHDTHGDEHADHGLTDLGYIKIAIFLAVITAVEVVFSYTQDQLGAAFLPGLLILMAVKFFMVLLYFMHLRWDRPFNAVVLISSLAAVALFIILTLIDSHQYQPDMIPGHAPQMEP